MYAGPTYDGKYNKCRCRKGVSKPFSRRIHLIFGLLVTHSLPSSFPPSSVGPFFLPCLGFVHIQYYNKAKTKDQQTNQVNINKIVVTGGLGGHVLGWPPP